jgi:hypothetical protein
VGGTGRAWGRGSVGPRSKSGIDCGTVGGVVVVVVESFSTFEVEEEDDGSSGLWYLLSTPGW